MIWIVALLLGALVLVIAHNWHLRREVRTNKSDMGAMAAGLSRKDMEIRNQAETLAFYRAQENWKMQKCREQARVDRQALLDAIDEMTEDA